ncbi:hypothetical protein [Kitasatospora cineracea]|uniref:hypothetical protein n=1 Tax=Kitasatospora cineracea TaxID=88074 RepID=UPI0037FA3DF1
MIREHYPQAWQHLYNARQAEVAMASSWNRLLQDGLVEESVVTHADGSGVISAWLAWPPGAQAELTELFRDCVRELWACLDALVAESVEAFSVQQRLQRPKQPRFFPVADSAEGLQALLAESCMDGTLRSHVAMVKDCQPFRLGDGDEIVDRIRQGLAYLLSWEAALEAGAPVSVWTTPLEPQVHVSAPLVVDHLEASAPGAFDGQERVLARFHVSPYRYGLDVSAQAGTIVDLCFTEGFTPANSEDTFAERLSLTVEAVTRLAGSFAWLSSRVPGTRRVLPTESPDGTGSWTEAARSSRHWSAQELAALASSDTGLGRVRDADTLTLIVNTPEGTFERVVPHASPLRHHPRRGAAAETAVKDAAATWGLPDFVMTPCVERKGRGVREVSDGLLVVGNRGVIVQVKAREGEPGSTEREVSWIGKQLASASKQIQGTARRLKAGSVRMVNGRGTELTIDGPAIHWVGVTIIEHPSPPSEIAVPAHEGTVPSIALLRRDWEFLFDQLRSTHAVVGYLHRVGASAPVLGTEPERYYELAAADTEAAAEPVGPTPLRHGEQHRSAPLLPTAPAGSDDREAHAMVRIMLEDLATSPFGPEEEEPLQEVLASLDSLPVAHRTELGRLLLDALAAAFTAPAGNTTWRMRTFLAGPDQDQLGFVVCSVLTDITRAAFSSWLRLRHHERGEQSGTGPFRSIGVMLTPRSDGYRDWDTTMAAIDGDPELTDDEIHSYQELWNKPKNLP